MSEKPLLFNGEMVRAILEGRKTQTRRPMRYQPGGGWAMPGAWVDTGGYYHRGGDGSFLGTKSDVRSPYIKGDRLWVRETWGAIQIARNGLLLQWRDTDREHRTRMGNANLYYRADGDDQDYAGCWLPSIHMPRWASRITLEVTDVRAERVQDMTQADAAAEGAGPWWNPSDVVHTPDDPSMYCWKKVPEDKRDYLRGFVILWDSIYAKRGLGWDANPWVWVYTFKVVTP